MKRLSFLLLNLLWQPSLQLFTSPFTSSTSKSLISLCTNKHCRRDGREITWRVLRDFTSAFEDGSIVLEECGCIGSCGSGPNLRVESGKVYSGVSSSATIAAILSIEYGIEIPDAIVDAYSSGAEGKSWLDEGRTEEAIEKYSYALRLAERELPSFPAVETTLRIGRSEALLAFARSGGEASSPTLLREATKEALQAVRRESTAPRAWWALHDAFNAAGRQRSVLDALLGLLKHVSGDAAGNGNGPKSSSSNSGARNAAKAEARRLCEAGIDGHEICFLL
jgi:hypothetical protein